jgi:hypothetical protein
LIPVLPGGTFACMISPEKCLHLLHLLGFSAGEICFRRPGGCPEWHVDATRGGHTILAKAPTQRHAWAVATKMAGRLVRQGVVVLALVLIAGCQPEAVENSGDVVTVEVTVPSLVDTPPDLIDDPPDPIDYHSRH